MTSKNLFQLEIPRRANVCITGGEPLVSGSECYSILLEGAEEGTYERRDYCAACGAQQTKLHALSSVVSQWKSIIPVQKVVSDLPKQREVQALELLKETLQLNEDGAQSEAFVLALYLTRRRKIILRQEIKRESKKFLLYEIAESGDMLCVPKIALSELQVEAVQEKLAKKFKAKRTD